MRTPAQLDQSSRSQDLLSPLRQFQRRVAAVGSVAHLVAKDPGGLLAMSRRGDCGKVNPMSHVRRFDHVGITVADLDTATAFFVGLGLEVEGRTVVEGEFLDTVSGIPS